MKKSLSVLLLPLILQIQTSHASNCPELLVTPKTRLEVKHFKSTVLIEKNGHIWRKIRQSGEIKLASISPSGNYVTVLTINGAFLWDLRSEEPRLISSLRFGLVESLKVRIDQLLSYKGYFIPIPVVRWLSDGATAQIITPLVDSDGPGVVITISVSGKAEKHGLEHPEYSGEIEILPISIPNYPHLMIASVYSAPFLQLVVWNLNTGKCEFSKVLATWYYHQTWKFVQKIPATLSYNPNDGLVHAHVPGLGLYSWNPLTGKLQDQ